jgi:hypothetical protein
MATAISPKTSYVRNRLGRTTWADRKVIHDLLTIENYLSGCPCGGWHSLWVRRGLMTHYPVEAVIIREEIRVGVQLTEKEARQWLRDEATARLAQDAARRVRQRAERDHMERDAFQGWLEAGGLP